MTMPRRNAEVHYVQSERMMTTDPVSSPSRTSRIRLPRRTTLFFESLTPSVLAACRRTIVSFYALFCAASVGWMLWRLWPDLVDQAGGLDNAVGVLVGALCVIYLYRAFGGWTGRRADEWDVCEHTPVARRAVHYQHEQSLLDELGDELLVSTALTRATDPDDRVAVTALVEHLRTHDQRTKHKTAEDLDELRMTALHEAAHAVIALATGASIHQAVVYPARDGEGSSSGNVEVTDPLADNETQLWASLHISLAGMVLDHRGGRRDGGSAADIHHAEIAALHLISAGIRPPGYEGEMTTTSLIATATAGVKDLLDIHTDAVNRIADALVTAVPTAHPLRDCDIRPLFAVDGT